MTESIEQSDSLDSRALLAKESNTEADKLIEEFLPFLHGTVSKYALRSNSTQREEMVSVAMLAFYEAIQSYDSSKGHFFPFVSTIVKRRLIDSVRKNYRTADTVSLDDEVEGSAQNEAFAQASIRSFNVHNTNEMLVLEIEQYKAELGEWGITMEALAKQSPKHERVRKQYRDAVKAIAASPDIMQTIQLKRYFPVKAVSEITGLPLKNLERARMFIIASLIIVTGDYDFLSEYISAK